MQVDLLDIRERLGKEVDEAVFALSDSHTLENMDKVKEVCERFTDFLDGLKAIAYSLDCTVDDLLVNPLPVLKQRGVD